MRIARRLLGALMLAALLLGAGCVRDQEAARTRLPGVDKKPDQENTRTGTTDTANENDPDEDEE